MRWWPFKRRNKAPKSLPLGKEEEPTIAGWLDSGDSGYPYGRFEGVITVDEADARAIRNSEVTEYRTITVDLENVSWPGATVAMGLNPVQAQVYLHQHGLTALDEPIKVPSGFDDDCWQETHLVLGWSPPLPGPQERAFLLTERQLRREAPPLPPPRGEDGKFLPRGPQWTL